jgi:hypothetical protein
MKLLPDGVYIGLSETAYFAQDRLGSSDLKTLGGPTPADWWWKSRHNPNRKEPPWKVGNDRDYGRAFHYLLLEGEEVYRRPRRRSAPTRLRHQGRQGLARRAAPRGKTILTEEMDRNIRIMVPWWRHHPQLGHAMAEGLSEVSVFWTDEQGHRLRARFDKLLPASCSTPRASAPTSAAATIRTGPCASWPSCTTTCSATSTTTPASG